jgi:hypothetical protein
MMKITSVRELAAPPARGIDAVKVEGGASAWLGAGVPAGVGR